MLRSQVLVGASMTLAGLCLAGFCLYFCTSLSFWPMVFLTAGTFGVLGLGVDLVHYGMTRRAT